MDDDSEYELTESLWFQKPGDEAKYFTISIGKPYPLNDEHDNWAVRCSLGAIMPCEISALTQVNAYSALLGAFKFVAIFLNGKQEQGYKFYYDEDSLTNNVTIKDINELFWGNI